MASATTPDHKPPYINTTQSRPVRRVHTLPAKLADETNGEPQITHLFEAGFAKVVAFQSIGRNKSGPASRSNSIGGEDLSEKGTSQDGGILPWVSSTERTLAAGPLRIYRVSNTGVSFLNSGEFLRPMLSRSQCWCVDDKSTFVLRVRENAYYRIELPFGTAEEKERVEEFKKTLDSLLRYEKTPCPFRDGFVDPDEPPPTPGRRMNGRTSIGKAKKWILNKIWEPEDGVWPVPSPVKSEPLTPEASPLKQFMNFEGKQLLMNRRGKGVVAVGGHQKASDFPLTMNQRSPISPKSATGIATSLSPMRQTTDDVFSTNNPDMMDINGSVLERKPLNISMPYKPLRSVTVPTQLMKFPSSSTNSGRTTTDQAEGDNSSLSSDHESFYSVDEVDDDFNFDSRSQSIDAKTFTEGSPPETPRAPTFPSLSDTVIPKLVPSSTTAQSTSFAIPNANNQDINLRRPFLPIMIEEDDSPRTPAPPICQPLSVLSPTFPSPSAALNGTNGIIQRACAMLMGTPVHLVVMMIRIAARILRKIPGGDKIAKIPGAWDSDFEDEADDESEEEWNDVDEGEDQSLLDDFGYPLGKQKEPESVKFSSLKTEARAGVEHDNHDSNDHEHDDFGID